MQLYAGASTQFVEDAVQNRIADKLKAAFADYYRHQPAPSEVASWRNSLSRMKDVIERSELLRHGVLLEYQLPLSSRRLDCMVTGKSAAGDSAVIVELKQWEQCDVAEGENEVCTFVGGARRDVLHPSVQVGQYEQYLRDGHTAFHEGERPVELSACAYLHNYAIGEGDALRHPKYREAAAKYPLFPADGMDSLCEYLTTRLAEGEGLTVLERVRESRFRASKKLLEHVGEVIKSNKAYILLDEQKVVYDDVFVAARKAAKTGKKTAFIVHGGPGTGKSVVALNLMADLSKEHFNCHYATGSKAFTETLRKITGTRASAQFKYFNSYATAGADELDVLVLDESHRIRKTSVNQYTPKDKRSGVSQIEELLKVAKVGVFFIDDRQAVRPGEIGHSEMIRRTALDKGHEVKEFKLDIQFRCSGSEAFVSWIDNTLEIDRTPHILWKGDERFDFRVFDSPQELDDAIRKKAAEGHSARMTAGFCWPWSEPKADGTLVEDVVLDGYKRPWNAKSDKGRLAPGIPKSSYWAYDPKGIDQVGCVYTAQGFEFDYAGVIFGKDLVYDPSRAAWEGRPDQSADGTVKKAKQDYLKLVKNTYRVLLSRGLKGCYVYFADEGTKNFFLSRMEISPRVQAAPAAEEPVEILPSIAQAARWTTHLPVYSLAVAAGGFSEAQEVRPQGWVKADLGRALSKDMFVARVKGRSMEPTIKDGAYCVFRIERGGSRSGKVVLVESRHVTDPESGGRYTVKRYTSEKELSPDGTWRHKRIVLAADNPEFADIVLEGIEPASFRVAAEFVAAL